MNELVTPTRLSQLLADIFDIPANEVTMDLSAGSIPAWDSFGHMQAILAIEQEFRVHFDLGEVDDLTTVARLKAALESRGVQLCETT